MSVKDKIIDKIKKLKAHATSAEKIGSEAEAQSFAAMMQKQVTFTIQTFLRRATWPS
jgi:hypothetical protein